MYRRFLRARKFNVKLAKQMFRDCQKWRASVEGEGIDGLYRKIDPFDVRGHIPSVATKTLIAICSIQNVKLFLIAGQCGMFTSIDIAILTPRLTPSLGSIRLVLPSLIHHRDN